jgi:hypothetical protein
MIVGSNSLIDRARRLEYARVDEVSTVVVAVRNRQGRQLFAAISHAVSSPTDQRTSLKFAPSGQSNELAE